MNEHTFVLAVCLLTVIAHISLLWQRGWLIGECRKEQRRMRTEWSDFKEEQEKWKRTFENDHQLPWARTDIKRRSA